MERGEIPAGFSIVDLRPRNLKLGVVHYKSWISLMVKPLREAQTRLEQGDDADKFAVNERAEMYCRFNQVVSVHEEFESRSQDLSP